MDPFFFINRTLELASLREGFTRGNPAVGALVVKDGVVIAEGYHKGAGGPHAEVVALEQAGDRAEGATLYVSLEPCCHFGRTPPCTDLIIQKKVARVVFDHVDPNPKVQTRGQAALREAGIACVAVSSEAGSRFYRAYDHWTIHREPFVTAKIALSLDGKYASLDDNRLMLTGNETNVLTHIERKKHDAILTTSETILKDNPLLNARTADGAFSKQIYILDPSLRVPKESEVFKKNRVTLLISEEVSSHKIDAMKAQNAECLRLPTQDGIFAWSQIKKTLGDRGVHSLWVEAGGATFAKLLSEKALNRAMVYLVPKVAGRGKTLGDVVYDFRTQGQTVTTTLHGSDVCFEILW